MSFKAITLAACVAAFASSSAFASSLNNNKKLSGSYSFTSTRICAQSTAGFGANLQALGPVSDISSALETVDTFDGQGHLTIKGRVLTINSNTAAGSFPVSESEFTCSGTYVVQDDNTFTTQYTCTGTQTNGNGAGLTFTSTGGGNPSLLRGSLVLLRATHPTPETITFSSGLAYTRLCVRSGTGVKLD